jgi:hypothetical protein
MTQKSLIPNVYQKARILDCQQVAKIDSLLHTKGTRSSEELKMIDTRAVHDRTRHLDVEAARPLLDPIVIIIDHEAAPDDRLRSHMKRTAGHMGLGHSHSKQSQVINL